MTMQNWQIEFQDTITVLTISKPNSSQNVLSAETLVELEQAIDQIQGAYPRGLIIRSDKEKSFISGADVSEFQQVESADQALQTVAQAHKVFDRIERLSFPTVAMINGHCLGGGLELALVCDYRVCCDEPSVRLGLPEVMLGIHPGFGGSVRMIEQCGVPDAMDLMLSGRTVAPNVAKKMGLVDLVVPQRQLMRSAQYILEKNPGKNKISGWKSWLNIGPARALMANVLTKKVASRACRAHYPAPYSMIDLWKQYGGERNQMLKQEQRSASNLVITDTSRNLVKVFFLQEQLKSLGKPEQVSGHQLDIDFQHVHVIGAGVMGGDIASWCALKGMHVTVQDQNTDALARATQRAHSLFQKKLRNRLLVKGAMDRFEPDLAGSGARHADVIIEAIFENAEAKMNLFAEIEKIAKPGAILATNTSSIPLEVISNALAKPGRLVGLHFFNPVAKMQLVEIVIGNKTFSKVTKRAQAFSAAIGRLPLPVQSSPGFLVNRILMPYLMEAVELHKEGVANETIDKVATSFGMPMGPIMLADTVGLDICQHVAENLTERFGGDLPPVLLNKIESGKLGKKSGEGFYRWEKGRPVKNKSNDKSANRSEIENRLVFRYLNETVACLYEGIVESGQLADGGLIFGTGFAPFRGGPVNYIIDQGQEKMLDRLEQLHEKFGDRFKPGQGWRELKLVNQVCSNSQIQKGSLLSLVLCPG